MKTKLVQTWVPLEHRSLYRPVGEPIDTRLYTVEAILEDDAKNFILQHHYSGSYPNARRRYGLFWGPLLVGVAVFSHPVNEAIFAPFPGERGQCLELGRLVLLDRVPSNAESWFIARCFDLLRREEMLGVVSFSDPVPRETAAGLLITPGHVGTIYQATNAIYTGKSKARPCLLLPDGTMFHERSIAKIRARDSRWESAAKPLVLAGAVPLHPDEDAAAWVKRWATELCRPLVHGGNHRYYFPLLRPVRRHVDAWLAAEAKKRRKPMVLPYPKMNDARLLASMEQL